MGKLKRLLDMVEKGAKASAKAKAEPDRVMATPFYEEKVWGRVHHIFASSDAAVSLLEIKAGFRCSKHRHCWRINLFAVQEGKVRICWYEGEGTTTLRTILLGPGDTYEIPTNIYHWFEVVESGRMVEVYWRSSFAHRVEHDDIERLDVGGPI